jgi:hypothetical protein
VNDGGRPRRAGRRGHDESIWAAHTRRADAPAAQFTDWPDRARRVATGRLGQAERRTEVSAHDGGGRRHGRTRLTRLVGATVAVAMLGACSDDDNAPSDDPGGGEVEDNPEGVTGGGSTIIDADVPVSNVSNAEEAPLDPAEPGST